MNKLLVLVVLLAMVLSGCANKTESTAVEDAYEVDEYGQIIVPRPEGDVVEISERLFIAQSNDIYLNAEDYFGKTIRYEGIFKTAVWKVDDVDTTHHFVIRYGPGCCGYDGEAGFEVTWDGPLPEENDWCEVAGILEDYEEEGIKYLRLVGTSLTVLEERGAEFVAT